MTSILSPKALALLAVPMCVAVLAWGSNRYSAARHGLRLAEAQNRAVVAAASEIEVLKRSTPTVAAGARPQPNISGQVTDVLVEAGLAPALLTNLTPESDTAVDTGNIARGMGTTSAARYRRQSARLTLEPATMPDLGRFLAAWRTSQPQWAIASINVSPLTTMKGSRGRSGATSTGSVADASEEQELVSPNRPVRVNLVIECLYVDQAPSASKATPVPSNPRP
jgi:hypothetical protein